MAASAITRDYGLKGQDSRNAVAAGLAGATWYACPLPRKELKGFMQRSDGPALRDTAIWISALLAIGLAAYLAWGTWLALPAFIVYGVLYASASDSRWHECGHGTAFKTRWMNDVVYQIASFCVLRQPTVWRWSHARHHTDTIIVGRDREIAVPRPPDLLGMALNLFNLKNGTAELASTVRHAFGSLSEEERDFIPAMEHPKVFRTARIWLAIWLGVIGLSVALGTILPLLFVGLPSFYGAWLHLVFGVTQHAGLAEDVLDHRLNSRTVYMNPVFRFIYWNMNYRVEHHMFPMVPYHALPRLHARLKADFPPPYNGLLDAYREIIPALLRQRRDPTYFVERQLPPAVAAREAALAAAA